MFACPICKAECRKFGKNRNGSQRYRCVPCAKAFTDESTRPVDRRLLTVDKTVLCLRMLLEGNSIRSTERLTEVHRDTIIATMVDAGNRCEEFMERAIRNVQVNDVQADEIWGFVGCKERTREEKGYADTMGDAWCYVAIERDTKLVITWHVDKRTSDATMEFALKLRDATSGRFQLSTDGFKPYRTAIPYVLGHRVDFAQLVKTYGNAPEHGTAARYSPGQVTGTQTVVMSGNPEDARICTSHAERQNLSMRMSIRRMTRLTNAHSKKWENHRAALALYFAFYDFCRVHTSLTVGDKAKGEKVTRITPAMKAGLTDHVWSVAELLAAIAE
jgi:transposase-like protein/IS1 family transposase